MQHLPALGVEVYLLDAVVDIAQQLHTQDSVCVSVPSIYCTFG